MQFDIESMIRDSLPLINRCIGNGRGLCRAYGCKFYMSDGSCAYGCKPPGKKMCA